MSILNVTGGTGWTGGACAAIPAAARDSPTSVAGSLRLSVINRLSIFLELRTSICLLLQHSSLTYAPAFHSISLEARTHKEPNSHETYRPGDRYRVSPARFLTSDCCGPEQHRRRRARYER